MNLLPFHYDAFERHDNGQSLWRNTRTLLKRTFDVSGFVYINFSEPLTTPTDHLPDGWYGTLGGFVTDVGTANGQHWIDVNYNRHVHFNLDYTSSDSTNHLNLLNAIGEAPSPERNEEILSLFPAVEMQESIEEVVGNLQVLTPPSPGRIDVTQIDVAALMGVLH